MTSSNRTPAGAASTTSHSCARTWTPPCGSTSGCSAPAWSRPSAPPEFRHYFFEIGVGNTLAFFEYQDVPLEHFAKPAGVPSPRATQFDHLSFALVDEEALLDMRSRLKAAGCEVTDVVDHGFIRSIYFNDPNGIALEASYWVVDPTGWAEVSLDDDRLFGDRNPVAAVDEIRSTGRRRARAATPASSTRSPATPRTGS